MILTINSGSSSVRLDGFERRDGAPERAWSRRFEGSRAPEALEFLAEWAPRAAIVAHRVVHGGTAFRRPTLIDDEVANALEDLVPLAPLHNGPALAWIHEARGCTAPGTPHVAVFDTAFFAGMPEAAATYAIPAELARRHGIRRLGFHGLAHESMWRQWAAGAGERAADARVVSFQLGSGCSAAAVRGGVALDASMGFTPLEGLVMATRAGDIDPGVIPYLMREAGMSGQAVENMLSNASGLRGLAGEADMRRLVERDDEAARLAVAVYCHRARRYLGAFLAVLGGADAVLFGGGVGENQPAIRARILEGMEFAGIHLDAAANDAARGTSARIAATNSQADIRVVPVDEAQVLAGHALAAVHPAP